MLEPDRQAPADAAAAFRAAVQEGIEAAEAGRMVPYEAVRRWLLSWGTEDERSRPQGG